MGAATFTASSIGILATFIIDDLSITRAELGIVLAVVNVAAAVLSPIAGRITDRIGGKAAIIALFVLAAAPLRERSPRRQPIPPRTSSSLRISQRGSGV